ncbi:MAG TPA: cytochrome c oxidase subunit 3 [Thermoanaerobaculia bacterium]
MIQRQVIDVSALPDHAFGSRSIMWWATMGIIAIEATVFAVAIASYFYLQGNEATWPPANTALPGIFWPTVNVAILLASLFPNQQMKKAAEGMEVRKLRVWMAIANLFALAFIVVRVFEYRHLNVSWDSNAYGSITWTLLSLHTVHLVTDFVDTVVLMVLMFTARAARDPRRFVDVAENSFYWYFVVLSWIPIYAVLYWAPRLL